MAVVICRITFFSARSEMAKDIKKKKKTNPKGHELVITHFKVPSKHL